MKVIKETTLHPEGNDGVDLYPKTNINQVQELPQKLTSVENQINQLNIDKLSKPTNPSAESAVTMLADGTVGTKPLSEIGGGGKLYLHMISFILVGDTNQTLYVRFKSNKDSQCSLSELTLALIGEIGEYWIDESGGSGAAFNVKIYYIRDASLDNGTLNIDMTSVTQPTNLNEDWSGQITTYTVTAL